MTPEYTQEQLEEIAIDAAEGFAVGRPDRYRIAAVEVLKEGERYMFRLSPPIDVDMTKPKGRGRYSCEEVKPPPRW